MDILSQEIWGLRVMVKISDIKQMLVSKQASCTEITRKYLDACAKENDTLRAYITITEKEALEAAEKVDGKLASGGVLSPLEGVPFCLKDNISTSSVRTTCASKMLENYVPVYDAHVWQLLKENNAVMLGKGNMDEFAMGSTCETSYFGGALNPHNTAHVAGGSSGGGASAVAGGLAVYAIGSDTGGSIRQPASFCGLVGLKPTYGAVSRRGLIAYASSFDQIGPITSCVEDAAAVFDAITCTDPMDMTHKSRRPVSPLIMGEIRGMKIGVAHEFFEGLNPDVKCCLEKAISTCREMGAEIIDVSFPLLKYSLPAYYILACAEASSNLGRYDAIRYGYKTENYSSLDEMICLSRSEGFGAEVRRRILLGTYVLSAGYFDAYYKKAQKLRASITQKFSQILERCDCILTPTVPVTAMKCGSNMSPVEMYQSDICTVSVNIAGVPAVSVPCGFDASGLPVGMQLIGGHFREDVILNAALAFERGSSGCYIKDSGLGVKL